MEGSNKANGWAAVPYLYYRSFNLCFGNVDVNAMQTVDVAAYENCQEYDFSGL